MRHIGILGGTFDPIHKGHLWIASQAKEEYGLTEIWLMPAGNPYFKEGDPVTPALLRFQMTALAAGEMPGFFASDYEIRKEGRTYTAETLQGLCREYPEDRFYFIIGEDALLQLRHWYHPEILFRYGVILCAKRPEGPDEEERGQALLEEIRALKRDFSDSGCDIRLIHCREMDLSSTEIRKRVREGKPIVGLVPASVEAFIREQGLYRDGSNS